MTNQEHPSRETEVHKQETTTTARTGTTTARTGTEGPRTPLPSMLSTVSWGAVFAGALVALVVMSVLNLLGIAIGAAVFDVGMAQEGIGIGAGIWWTLTALIGLFFGGWTAGHFSTAEVRSDGLMHGVVTWSLFVLAGFLAVTTAIGQVLGGAFGFVGQNLSAAIAAMQPAELMEATMIQEGLGAEAIAEAEATMAAAGQQAADALAVGAGWAFVALLLGVLVCALGGSFGTVEPQERGEKRSKRFASRFRPRTA